MTNLINIELIRDYIAKNNLSKTKFCRLCKINISTLNRIFSGGNFNLIAIFKIARVLKVEVYRMFN